MVVIEQNRGGGLYRKGYTKLYPSHPPFFFIYCISLIDYCNYCNCISLIEFHLLINRKFHKNSRLL